MADEPLAPLPTAAPLRYDLTRSLSIEDPHIHHEHHDWLNAHPAPCDGSTGLRSPALNRANYPPQPRHTNNTRGEYPPLLATGFAEHPGDQSYRFGPPTTGAVSQQIQFAPGPPLLEYQAEMMAPVRDVPTDAPLSPPTLPHNIPGTSGGNFGPVQPEIPPAEDLKRLANYYLNNRDSHVDKLRMRRRRSGGFKVLILLEIDDLNTV